MIVCPNNSKASKRIRTPKNTLFDKSVSPIKEKRRQKKDCARWSEKVGMVLKKTDRPLCDAKRQNSSRQFAANACAVRVRAAIG